MIRGFFDPAGVQPFVSVAIRVPELAGQRWIAVNFLIDTGASQSCLHPLDAVRRMGVSPGRLSPEAGWPVVRRTAGVGGAAQFYECAAQYGFVHDDGSEQIETGVIWIAELTPANQTIPSLLGWDLLSRFELRVHGPTRSVKLERP